MAEKRLKPIVYSDVAYVDGVCRGDSTMERALYNHCKEYLDVHFKGTFTFANMLTYDDLEDIFQESILILFDNIRYRIIYVEGDEIKGKGGKPLSGKLTTYFMGIAKLKGMEWLRRNHTSATIDVNNLPDLVGYIFGDYQYDNDDEIKLTIIAECISRLPKGCNQILTMFYYYEKTLDDILLDLTTFKSKDALKTRKYKCTESLRGMAHAIYHSYLNS